ncbi:MAG TPA: DUF6297 family protein [Marmoricola sp.]
MADLVTARELNRQIRQWRRGRAQAKLVDVIGDAYVAIFSTLIIGSMVVSVLVQAGDLSARTCTADGCRAAITWGPWLGILAAAAATTGLARLFGPVFVSPAAASWLLPAPVDRGPLLRPRLALALLAALACGAGVAAAGAALAGDSVGVLLWTVAVGAGGCAFVGGAAALGQGFGSPVFWIPSMVLEAALVLVATRTLEPAHQHRAASPVIVIVAIALLGSAILVSTAAFVRLARLRSADLTHGGALTPALSGALATLDLALVLDVVVAQRWRRRGQVRPVRGGPDGPAALCWRDLTRLRRSPSHLLVLIGAAAVPYAAARFGIGRAVVPIAVVAGFLALVPLLVSLRVLARTPGITRLLPFPDSVSLRYTLVVPGVCALLYGAVAAPAMHGQLGSDPGLSVTVAVAVALSALAAAVRWVTGRPPDYARPLVSTPAGAVPTNLYGSAFRGFDIALVTSVPLLLAPDGNGATFSIAIALGTLAILVTRAVNRP